MQCRLFGVGAMIVITLSLDSGLSIQSLSPGLIICVHCNLLRFRIAVNIKVVIKYVQHFNAF